MIRNRIVAVAVGAAVIAGSTLAASPAFALQYDFTNTFATPGDAQFTPNSVHIDYTATTFTETLTLGGTLDDSSGYEVLLAVSKSPSPLTSVHTLIDVSVDGSGAVTAGEETPGSLGVELTGVTATYDGANHITVSVPSSAIPYTGSIYEFGILSETVDDNNVVIGDASNGAYGGFGPLDIVANPTTTSVQVSFPYQEYGVTPATAAITVTPAQAGSVTLYDGTTPIGTAAVTSTGTVDILLPQMLSSGIHNLSATFIPTATNYLSSTSVGLPFSVHSTAKATKTTVKLSKSSQRFKKKSTAKVTVTVSGKPAGKVVIYDGKKVLKTITLKKGAASFALSSKLKKGKHKVQAVYTPMNIEAFTTSTSKTVKLKVVK